jgi:hypothetical protein
MSRSISASRCRMKSKSWPPDEVPGAISSSHPRRSAGTSQIQRRLEVSRRTTEQASVSRQLAGELAGLRLPRRIPEPTPTKRPPKSVTVRIPAKRRFLTFMLFRQRRRCQILDIRGLVERMGYDLPAPLLSVPRLRYACYVRSRNGSQISTDGKAGPRMRAASPDGIATHSIPPW